jgi:hypothetical protein
MLECVRKTEEIIDLIHGKKPDDRVHDLFRSHPDTFTEIEETDDDSEPEDSEDNTPGYHWNWTYANSITSGAWVVTHDDKTGESRFTRFSEVK